MDAQEITQLFRQRFGADPEVIAIAPGRVNLIGEHTDYNDGYVFPAAIDRGLLIAASRSEQSSEVHSRQMGDGETFDVAEVQPGSLSESWSQYPAGMAWAMRESGTLSNIRAVVDSDIPIGSGVSSSAAIEMAFGVVWNTLDALALDNARLAVLGQKCENGFVGVNSGIMDQMASAMGKAGHAMFLDTRTLQIEYARVPEQLTVVLCDTKKPRALTDSAYNERRSQCEEAARILGVPALRDASLETLESRRREMPEVVYRRARHVVSENNRCLRFRSALEDQALTQIGSLMRSSHESLRDDYEVSCPELDAMAESAWAAPGCVGARMTGAGFGGACVALVQTEAVDRFVAETLKAYDAATGLGGEAMACAVAEGARVL
jgi:galactokinase